MHKGGGGGGEGGGRLALDYRTKLHALLRHCGFCSMIVVAWRVAFYPVYLQQYCIQCGRCFIIEVFAPLVASVSMGDAGRYIAFDLSSWG